MNKKSVTIIAVVVILAICVCLGIVLVGGKDSENVNLTEGEIKNEVKVEETTSEENKEKVTSVALDSKIGTEVTNKIYVPNIYSKEMYKELDKNGLSNEFRIMYTFGTMTTLQEYSNYLREGEDYIGSYITQDDLEKVEKTIFKTDKKLNHKAVFENDTYNAETKNYVIVARGFFGDSLEYVVEIPYEINEYEDRLEVNLYRMYITREYDKETEQETVQKDKVYYDEAKTKLATTIQDENMSDEIASQKDILKAEIKNGKIQKESLDKTTWIFEKVEGKYLISAYRK